MFSFARWLCPPDIILGRQNNLDSLNCNYWDFFPAAKEKVDCAPTKVGLDGKNSHISLDWPYLSLVFGSPDRRAGGPSLFIQGTPVQETRRRAYDRSWREADAR